MGLEAIVLPLNYALKEGMGWHTPISPSPAGVSKPALFN